MPTKHTFQPDYAIPPGTTLREVLETRGMSQADLAMRTGLTEKTISQIVNGAAPISYETAAKFELAVGVPARFWNSRESQFREALLREEEAKQLETAAVWLKQIPVRELIERKFIQPAATTAAQAREVLKFFQVSSTEAWDRVWREPQVQFRGAKAHASRPGYVAAWIRMGEVAAEKAVRAPYDAKKFRAALEAIRLLTTKPAAVWQPKLAELCAAAGVVVVFVPEIPRAGVSGVTKWLSSEKAMIILSLKYKRDDQFWFSFFHEACHVLRHGKKTIFYEMGDGKDTPEEQEADTFSSDFLIPVQSARQLPYLKSKAQIAAFASEIGIAAGIVVGRLQHDGLLPKAHCNDLKRVFVWSAKSGKESSES